MSFFRAFGWVPAAAILLGATACQKCPLSSNAAPPPQGGSAAPSTVSAGALPALAKSAEPSSFEAVARHLDFGGGFLLYLSTESFLKAASTKLNEMVPLFLSVAKNAGTDKAQAEAIWKSVSRVTAQSGIDEISGLGMSSIALEPGFYQTKSLLHHYEGKGNGFLWKMSGGKAQALDLVPYLPAQTAFAGSSDLTLVPLWEALVREAGNNQALAQGIQAVTMGLELQSGLKLEKLLSGIGPNYSVVLTLDPAHMTTVPAGDKALTIPEPALAIVVQVQDESLLNRVDQETAKIPGIIKKDTNELKLRVIPVPLPFPFLHPAVAWKSGMLIVTSNEALIHEMLEIKAGKKTGLAALPEYKKLTAGLPPSVSGFQFIAPIFQKTMMQVQMAQMQQNAGVQDPAMKQIMEYMIGSAPSQWAVGVAQNTPEGWLSIGRGSIGPTQLATAALALPAGVMAGIAVPNFTRAKGRSEASRILEDARMIDATVDQWAIEHNKKSGIQPTTDDIKAYLKTGSELWKNANSHPGKTTIPSSVAGMPDLLIPAVDSAAIIPRSIFEKFRDTCPEEFWKPFLKN